MRVVIRVGRQRADLDLAQRGLGLDLRHQLRQEQRVEVVACGDTEGVACGLRIEPPRVSEQDLGRTQDTCAGLQHAQAAFGRCHARAGAHQQWVIRQVAQTLERSRHRRLVHAQTDGGPRYAAFSEHGVQDPYEMEVYLVEKGLVSHGVAGVRVIRKLLYRAM